MGPKKKDDHHHSPPPRRGDSTKAMADNEETSSQWTSSSSSVDDAIYPDMAHYLYALHKIAKHQRDDRDRGSTHYWQQRYDRSKQRRRELALQLAIERQRNADFLRRNRLLRKKWWRTQQPPMDTDDDRSSDTSFATPPQQEDTSDDSRSVEQVSIKDRPLPPLPTTESVKGKTRATPLSDTSSQNGPLPTTESVKDKSRATALSDTSSQNGPLPTSRAHDLKASVVEPRFDSTAHASSSTSRFAPQSTRNKPDDPSKDDAQSATAGTQTSPVLVSHSPSSTTSSGSDYRRIYEFLQQVADTPRPPPHQHSRRVSMSKMASDILAASVLPRQSRRQRASSPSHPPEATSPIPSQRQAISPIPSQHQATSPSQHQATLPSQRQASSHKPTMPPEAASPTLSIESRSTETSFHRTDRPTSPDMSTRGPSTSTPATEYTTKATQTDISHQHTPATEYTTRAMQTDISMDRPSTYTPATEYTTRGTQTDVSYQHTPAKEYTTRGTQTDPFYPSPKQPSGHEFYLDLNTQLNMLQDEINHIQFMQRWPMTERPPMQHWPIPERQPTPHSTSSALKELITYILYFH